MVKTEDFIYKPGKYVYNFQQFAAVIKYICW